MSRRKTEKHRTQHTEFNHSNMAYHFPYITRFHQVRSNRFTAFTKDGPRSNSYVLNLNLQYLIQLIWSNWMGWNSRGYKMKLKSEDQTANMIFPPPPPN